MGRRGSGCSQEKGGAGRGESKLTSFAPSLVNHSCPLAVIPNGGGSGCVRLEGAMGYGNPPAPESCPSMNSDTLSSQPLCGGNPPGPVLSPLPIPVHIYCDVKCWLYSEGLRVIGGVHKLLAVAFMSFSVSLMHN